MDKIILVEGNDLEGLLDQMGAADVNERRPIYRMRFCIDGDAVKIKVNEGTWSPGLGKLQGPY